MDYYWYAELALSAHCSWLFGLFFLGKRVRKAKSSMPKGYSPKEGGTTANFQIQIFALFSLLDSGNNDMCYFKGPGLLQALSAVLNRCVQRFCNHLLRRNRVPRGSATIGSATICYAPLFATYSQTILGTAERTCNTFVCNHS